MLATDRHEQPLDLRILAHFDVEYFAPLHAGGVALVCLHAAVQVWQPTQRLRSATIT